VPPAAEWLLDNFHLVEAEVVQLRRDLPPGYHRQLPMLQAPGTRPIARIHLLAVELLRHSDAGSTSRASSASCSRTRRSRR
jgi:cyclic beta-1,2-glucan synthetase